ncbi:response regulator [Asticcacaulis sp. AND118]|uniref:response regulator n=1 Tax=Asticcacaulis sp. AND118 TaxID=2840468 RepID=UPI001CFFF9C3|nr:response regulator [Asticcacaulis sp. AND118]UDF03199.1 response regulator [Asticcacaulis sp. AND118]
MSHPALTRILYIEDDEALGRLLQKRFRRHNLEVDLAETAEAGLERLLAQAFDLVLLDYNLPGMNGIEMLKVLKAREDSTPVIILTAGGDEAIALEAMELGAADYAVKDINQAYLDLLPAVMQAAFTKERLLRENERQRQELQASKERAEAASQAKTDFLATMSHEIRTPLNVVTGLSDILIKSSLNDDQYRIVETLRTNAQLLLRLINDLLDISRIEDNRIELEMTAFRPADVLEDLRMMFAQHIERKGLDFALTDNTRGVSVRGDRTRLQQIVMNLISNALKFTARGEIELTGEAQTHVGKTGGDMVDLTLCVRDTGIGIPDAKRSQIFDKFTQADASITRRFGGSGLGLSIARALVDVMGGEISVESQEGRGSLFSVRLSLPAAVPAPVVDEQPPVPAPASGERPRVLIVEDYAPNVMVATLMLEEMGYEADAAESGPEALERLESVGAYYHAILMDVQMHEMDGFETTRRIREMEAARGFRHQIIGVTAHALAGDRERCIEAGMDDYLSKPIQPGLLAQKLRALSPA